LRRPAHGLVLPDPALDVVEQLAERSIEVRAISALFQHDAERGFEGLNFAISSLDVLDFIEEHTGEAATATLPDRYWTTADLYPPAQAINEPPQRSTQLQEGTGPRGTPPALDD
jgi:hypothetical protein